MNQAQVGVFLEQARRGRLYALKYLAQQKHCNVHARRSEDGVFALYLAAQEGHTHIVDWYASRGFRWDMRTDTGHTALHAAAQAGRTDVVRRLLLHEEMAAWCSKGPEGERTALQLALQNGHAETAACFAVLTNVRLLPKHCEGHVDALRAVRLGCYALVPALVREAVGRNAWRRIEAWGEMQPLIIEQLPATRPLVTALSEVLRCDMILDPPLLEFAFCHAEGSTLARNSGNLERAFKAYWGQGRLLPSTFSQVVHDVTWFWPLHDMVARSPPPTHDSDLEILRVLFRMGTEDVKRAYGEDMRLWVMQKRLAPAAWHLAFWSFTDSFLLQVVREGEGELLEALLQAGVEFPRTCFAEAVRRRDVAKATLLLPARNKKCQDLTAEDARFVMEQGLFDRRLLEDWDLFTECWRAGFPMDEELFKAHVQACVADKQSLQTTFVQEALRMRDAEALALCMRAGAFQILLRGVEVSDIGFLLERGLDAVLLQLAAQRLPRLLEGLIEGHAPHDLFLLCLRCYEHCGYEDEGTLDAVVRGRDWTRLPAMEAASSIVWRFDALPSADAWKDAILQDPVTRFVFARVPEQHPSLAFDMGYYGSTHLLDVSMSHEHERQRLAGVVASRCHEKLKVFLLARSSNFFTCELISLMWRDDVSDARLWNLASYDVFSFHELCHLVPKCVGLGLCCCVKKLHLICDAAQATVNLFQTDCVAMMLFAMELQCGAAISYIAANSPHASLQQASEVFLSKAEELRRVDLLTPMRALGVSFTCFYCTGFESVVRQALAQRFQALLPKNVLATLLQYADE